MRMLTCEEGLISRAGLGTKGQTHVFDITMHDFVFVQVDQPLGRLLQLGKERRVSLNSRIIGMAKTNQAVEVSDGHVIRRADVVPQSSAAHQRRNKAGQRAGIAESVRIDAEQRKDVRMFQLPPNEGFPSKTLNM
jgi:hypothetical protein